MRLARATNYAARALVALAPHGRGRRTGLASLARELAVPKAFLAKVLQRLARAGLVSSERGARGGYSLARDAGDITLRDVLGATEGGASLARCLGRSWSCPRRRHCPARPAWKRIAEQLNSALESETIAALAAAGRQEARPGGRTCGTTRRR